MSPPISSRLMYFKRVPRRRPNMKASKVSVNATMPILAITGSIAPKVWYPMHGKLMPTKRASRLVAMAKNMIVARV